MIEVVVTHADGAAARHSVEVEQITIGRSKLADVTIDGAPEVDDLHLLAVPRLDGLWISPARDASVAPTAAGRVLGNEIVPFGAEIDIGSVTLVFRRVASEDRPAGLLGMRPLLMVALLAVALVLALKPGGREAAPSTSAAPPELFDEEAVTECPDAEQPLRGAREASSLGASKEARYAFDARDGLEAVTLYEVASRCFEAAGDQPQARASRARRDRMRRRLIGDYKSQRVFLERAREALDHAEMLRAARAVRAYVDHRGGPYRDWLIRTERYAEARIERKE